MISTTSRKRRAYSRPVGGYPEQGGRKSFRSSPAYIQPRRSSQEPGYVDLASANYSLDLTGSIALINTIPQGAGTSQRVGKRVTLKSLQCRGYSFAGSTANFNDGAIIIVYDKRPNGSLPAIADILVSASSTSFNNDVNSGRFRILKREDFFLMGNSTTPTDSSGCSNDFFFSLKGLPQVFKAAGTGAIDDIEEGAIYVITVGSNTAGTGAATANLGFRVRYYDN